MQSDLISTASSETSAAKTDRPSDRSFGRWYDKHKHDNFVVATFAENEIVLRALTSAPKGSF